MMQRLRRQVDQIDLKLLKLLQQRTKLSGEIGRTKRRHGAEIYVPGRERELLARVAALADGTLPAGAAQAIFREILSSSRAAQGQPPIGFLRASAEAVVPRARIHFGACDRYQACRSWRQMAQALEAGELAIGLLTWRDLTAILADARSRKHFLSTMGIVGEFPASDRAAKLLAGTVFIVQPRRTEMPAQGRRVLILIECKNMAHAVKSLLTSMPQPPIHSEHVALSPSGGGGETVLALLGLTLAEGAGGLPFAARPDVTTSIVGIYPGGEDYGG